MALSSVLILQEYKALVGAHSSPELEPELRNFLVYHGAPIQMF